MFHLKFLQCLLTIMNLAKASSATFVLAVYKTKKPPSKKLRDLSLLTVIQTNIRLCDLVKCQRNMDHVFTSSVALIHGKEKKGRFCKTFTCVETSTTSQAQQGPPGSPRAYYGALGIVSKWRDSTGMRGLRPIHPFAYCPRASSDNCQAFLLGFYSSVIFNLILSSSK